MLKVLTARVPMILHPCQTLNNQISICTSCSLNQSPYNPGLPTLGLGFLNPLLMIVGEAPGEKESEAGRPFVGRSGQLLQKLLQQANISLTDLYVTNTVKHRPPLNRDPTPDEINACKTFLFEEIEIVKPKLILCTGKISSYTLANAAGFRLPTSGLRGLKFLYKDIPVRLTWHPAYVMRNILREPELLQDIIAAHSEAKHVNFS